MKLFKQYILFIFYGILIRCVDLFLCDDKIAKYLEGNLFAILITVITLNLTSIIFLFSKIIEKSKGEFNDTINEVHLSVKEQIVIIPITLLINSISENILKIEVFKQVTIFDLRSIFLMAIFMFSVYSIWDIANAIFQYVKFKSKID